nr:hypothetical protein [Tanacetum cinerariifolium]
METEDPAIITKSLLNDYDNFIAKLSSDEPNSDALNAQHQSPKLAPSFANIVQSKSNIRVVKISELRNSEKVDRAAVAIPIGILRRAMIEVAEEELKESIMIAILMVNGEGHSLGSVDIEYEWTFPMCSLARFLIMARQPNKEIAGIKFTKPSLNLQYRRVEKGESYKTIDVQPTVGFEKTKLPKPNRFTSNVPKPSVILQNSFSSLYPDGEEAEQPQVTKNDADLVVNMSDSEVDEEIILDDRNGKSGLNFSPKQSEVRYVIFENNLSVCAVLESHASSDNLAGLCASIFRHWSWTSNGRLLWKCLCVHKLYVRDRPWCIFGDFNTALFLEDSTSGMSSMDISMREFKVSVMDIEVTDVQRTGLQFTWNQKPKGKLRNKPDAVQARLDDDPFNVDIRDEEASTMAAFNEALLL